MVPRGPATVLCCPLPDSALVSPAILGEIPDGLCRTGLAHGGARERVCRTGERERLLLKKLNLFNCCLDCVSLRKHQA